MAAIIAGHLEEDLMIRVAVTRNRRDSSSDVTTANAPRRSRLIFPKALHGSAQVCRSDVDQPCVIHVGSQNEPVSVVVSVYLHPVADAKTTYQGAFSAEFLSSKAGTGHESQVDITIEPGRTPTGFTVVGRLTSTPGRYFFRMALLAEVPMHSDPHQFEQTIPVDVIAS